MACSCHESDKPRANRRLLCPACRDADMEERQERAAIYEYDAKMPRRLAELRANVPLTENKR